MLIHAQSYFLNFLWSPFLKFSQSYFLIHALTHIICVLSRQNKELVWHDYWKEGRSALYMTMFTLTDH